MSGISNNLKEKTEKLLTTNKKLLEEIIGKSIELQIDWESFNNSNITNSEVAIHPLHYCDGFFVFRRLINAIKVMTTTFGGKSDLNRMVEVICISHSDQKKLILQKSTLKLQVNFNYGSFGFPKQQKLERMIGSLFKLSIRGYKKHIIENCIPNTEKSINALLHFSENESGITIQVDWDSLGKSHDMSKTLLNLVKFNGYYSFQNIVKSFKMAIEEHNVSQKKLKFLIKTIIIENIPGTNLRKKNAFLNSQKLYICGLWEKPDGYLKPEEIIPLLKHSSKLKKIENKLQTSSMNQDMHKLKNELLYDISECQTIRNGHYDYLRWLLSSPIFSRPDDDDIEAMEIFMKNHVNLQKTKKNQQEIFITGIQIEKINKRGTKQDRIMVLTNKATYTFKYNYKKKKVIEKSLNCYDHQDYCYTIVGELEKKKAKGGDNEKNKKKSSGSKGKEIETEMETKSEMGKENEELGNNESGKIYAIKLQTCKYIKPNIALEKVSKELGNKIIDFYEKLVEIQIENNENEIPNLDLLEIRPKSLSQLLKIAGKSFTKSNSSLPNLTFEGIGQISIVDLLSILEEHYSKIPNQPKIQTENLPIITLAWLLRSILEILRNTPNLNYPFHENPDLRIFLRSIYQQISKLDKESLPLFDLPTIQPISSKSFFEIINNTLSQLNNTQNEDKENENKTENKENEDEYENENNNVSKELFETIKIGKIELPKISIILEKINEVAESLPEINFPELPKIKIKKILEIIMINLGQIQINPIPLSSIEVSFDIKNLKIPSYDIEKTQKNTFLFKKKKIEKINPFCNLIFFPKAKSEKKSCIEYALIHRAIAMSANSPTWINKIYEKPVGFKRTGFGYLINKTSRGKANKKRK
ncbi:hypothetical protein M0812_18529 [Anaeramoeba flamelloides]|uniref:Uncharacterized protein n=1 Tax=Anaeramoeba flamelloides TaxID=1746091 RepID=A0AAV7Z2X5_9EUKA|nr:hypothetical protein M0812_18529 [Anaeramoeba flamelloides]